ncbi:hypothetical protein DL546_000445 [Coniochaeta pulveracea]|uniref:Uncharacterized protein n=1 Tax=Coniochaeta pulveracea TaxID=177199 RepID=A0A420XWY6_9PEZI|nr:hypothetical protein DL546_000445 [Coniochaeta pulveracea]
MSNSQLNTATTTGEPEVDETPPEYTEIDTPPPAYQETEALPEESSSRTHSDHLHEPPAPPRKSPSSLTRFLHNLAYPLAIILGLFITAGSTYLLVHHIQQLIATAAVDSDQQTWIRAALTQVYEPCYHGCPNCIEPEYAQDACRRTTAGNLDVSNLGGVVCDAYEIWNWTEKYPIVCLNAMGELLKKEALESKKRGYHNLLGLTVLTGRRQGIGQHRQIAKGE